MPIATIQTPDGKTMRLEVPEGATQEQIISFAQSQYTPEEQPEPSYFEQLRDRLVGGVEAAGSVASGIIAEPVAGVAGIAQSLNPMAEPGAGARAVESTRQAMTYSPRTESGKESLAAVSDFIAPVAEAVSGAERKLGDAAYEKTGSPAIAAAAMSAPTALLEVLGLAGAKAAISPAKQSRRLMTDAAPSSDKLFEVGRAVYKELDELGVTVKPDAYASLASKISRETTKAGLDKDLTPKAAKVVDRFAEKIGQEVSLTELDTLRKKAQAAASSLEPPEKALGAMIIDSVDEFLDQSGSRSLNNPSQADIGRRYKVARDVWGRGRRSELIQEAIESADLQASGLENGLRVQFRQILKNKKKRRYFNKDEIEAMNAVVKGTPGANIAKLLGRFGFSEGQATNIVGGSIGGAAGYGAFGPAGAIAIPVIGTVSRRLAGRLTKNNAKFADAIIRAGKDGQKITKAYMENTPKKLRRAEELSELLANPDIALDLVEGDGLVRSAIEGARRQRELSAAASVGAAKEGAIKEAI